MWIDDQILEQHREPLTLGTWVPDRATVVLGSSNDPASECRPESCAGDEVAILRRYGGGGTVVLYPGCVVVSIGCWVAEHFHNNRYFKLLNAAVNNCLHSNFKFNSPLTQAGISDLVSRDKKFGGTSLFRSRNYLLYQASLIVDCDFEMIEKYLAHPSREPDYRRGRNHRDFLTGLANLSTGISVAQVHEVLTNKLAGHVLCVLGSEATMPEPHQFSALQARIERARAELRK